MTGKNKEAILSLIMKTGAFKQVLSIFQNAFRILSSIFDAAFLQKLINSFSYGDFGNTTYGVIYIHGQR